MTSDIQRYTPLRTIVSYAMDELDMSVAEDDKGWLLGLRALTDLHMDISAEPITYRIPINANKTATIPPGSLSWTKIGIMDAHGQTSTLNINNALTKWRDNNPNRIDLLTPDVNDATANLAARPFFYNYFFDGNYYQLYGTPPGLIQYGSCRVDEDNGVVVLEPEFQYDHILYECISSPQRNDDYMVETVLQEAIIAFIKWKFKRGTDLEYYAEARKARRRLPGKKVTLQGINQVIRESDTFKLRS